jgi:hypothetical protein
MPGTPQKGAVSANRSFLTDAGTALDKIDLAIIGIIP